MKIYLRIENCANSRSLLSGEALVDDLGVGVDAQVVDGLSILRRRIGSAANVLQRRGASGSGEGLHDVGGWRGEGVKKKKKRRCLLQRLED